MIEQETKPTLEHAVMETVLKPGEGRLGAEQVKLLIGVDPLTGSGPENVSHVEFNPTHRIILMTGKVPDKLFDEELFLEKLAKHPFRRLFLMEGEL